MYAIISDRNQQTTVRVGDLVACDLNQDLAAGDTVTFDSVLLLGDEGETKIGTPLIEGAKVTGEVVGQSKGPKLVVFRFKRRKNVRVKKGHRQKYTNVRITAIDG
ncbi:MAG: 50S ribosomal protein L21 [Planctomycetota bacterium]|nr:50S ribosomal protein L21 [Planctomycetota bacterium]MDP6520477.1 50S ribosomal protein L21 [Planctomycetota bacterium]MDP6837716.1 50S ribosomal protein L21 [Planctomycetota bacterium]